LIGNVHSPQALPYGISSEASRSGSGHENALQSKLEPRSPCEQRRLRSIEFHIAFDFGGNTMKTGKLILLVAVSCFFAAAAVQAQEAMPERGRSTMHRGHYHHPAVRIHRHHHPHPLMRKTPRTGHY
jgi:hypothetical protein